MKACIFDFDGVIMDSEKYHHKAWSEVAREMGVEFSYDEYAPLKSTGRAVIIPYLLKKANIAYSENVYKKYVDIRAEKYEAASKLLSENDKIKGIEAFLRKLNSLKIPIAIASSSSLSGEIAKRFGLFDFFQAVVDGTFMLPLKPAPDIFLKAASLVNTAACDCVVFEDSFAGIEGAKKAGMLTVGVGAYLKDAADLTVENFENSDEILGYLSATFC